MAIVQGAVLLRLLGVDGDEFIFSVGGLDCVQRFSA